VAARFFGIDCGLSYRRAAVVYLLVKRERVTPNHWFYVADGDLMLNRVAEFRNFGSCAGRPATRCWPAR